MPGMVCTHRIWGSVLLTCCEWGSAKRLTLASRDQEYNRRAPLHIQWLASKTSLQFLLFLPCHFRLFLESFFPASRMSCANSLLPADSLERLVESPLHSFFYRLVE
jgi:hypothetical protein